MTKAIQTTDTNYSPEAISNALALWAAARTNAELRRSDDLQRDKVQIVAAFFDKMQIHPANVTSQDVKAWADGMEHLSPASRYKAVSRLSSFYKWLADEGGMKDLVNPAAAARPKAPKPYSTDASKTLSDEQMQSLLDYVKSKAAELDTEGRPNLTAKRDFCMLMLHIATGIRRDGVSSLMYRDVHINGIIRLTFRNKGGDLVTADVEDQDVKAALVDYIESCKAQGRTFTKDSPLFVAHRYDGTNDKMMNSRSFADNLKRYASAVGIEDIHVHQLRHTFSRIAGEELGSMTEVQEALGHSSLNTTRIYLARVGVKKDKSSKAVMSRFNKSKS